MMQSSKRTCKTAQRSTKWAHTEYYFTELSLSLYPKPSLAIVSPTNINPLKLNATQQITHIIYIYTCLYTLALWHLWVRHLEVVSTPLIQMNFTLWLSFGIISVGKRTCFPEPATELQLAFHKISLFRTNYVSIAISRHKTYSC